MGSAALLEQFAAVVVARASDMSNPETELRGPFDDERHRYRIEQEEAVLRALDTYRPSTPVCVGVHFGHTSARWVLPYGGLLTVDGPARRLVA